ncbi:MAG TPA: FkbM family methyltransferase, partial [Candidatus Paceibacterota bacterium]|nr:FkbM family methyltransferase [Candidatus Paceibacterota bacterium]
IKEIKKVPLIPINDLIAGYFRKTPNFISIDVEGNDFSIIKGLDFEKYRPEVFCIETLTYVENGFGHKITEISDYMLSQGYYVYADTNLNTIFIDRRKMNKKNE